MTRDEDKIDTVPVFMNKDNRVESQSLVLEPGERAELVIEPATPMTDPVLYVSSETKEKFEPYVRGVPPREYVVIEQIMHGGFAILPEATSPMTCKFGRQVTAVVTKTEPIKILLNNRGPLRAKIGASLVVCIERPGLYRREGKKC